MNLQNVIGKYRTGSWYQRSQKDITKLVIHHSASKMDKRVTDDNVLKMIQGWHEGKGWPGLSYHYCIMPNGNIYQCNAHEDITWHDTVNDNSLGILVHGYFHPDVNDQPTKEQLISLKELLDWLCTENPQFPADQDDVWGHRDVSATSCCGDNLYKYVKEYRDNKGSVSWVDVEAISDCEKKLKKKDDELSDMRDSRNDWRKKCKDTEDGLTRCKEISTTFEGKVSDLKLEIIDKDKHITEMEKAREKLDLELVDAICDAEVLEDKVKLLMEKEYTIKEALILLRTAITVTLKGGDYNG